MCVCYKVGLVKEEALALQATVTATAPEEDCMCNVNIYIKKIMLHLTLYKDYIKYAFLPSCFLKL